MVNSKEDDEFLGAESVDMYSLTKHMQRQSDNELVNVNQAKTTDQVLKDVAYAVKAKHQLEIDSFEEIGVALIANKANIKKTAKQFKMDATELRMLIRVEPILNAYWRAAYHEVKALVDDKVIELLEAGEDKDILKEVFRKMYAGRKMGGYNINELGGIGYGDAMAAEQQQHIKHDIEAEANSKHTIIIEFDTKTIELNNDSTVEGQLLDCVDAELEED